MVLLGFGAFSVRFGVFAAFSARLPESRALRAAPLGARCSGSSSALGSILGIPAEKPACALSQHPPPVATNKGERYQPGTVPGAVSGALATFRLLLPPQEDQKRLLRDRPDQPQNPKVLRIAIIGAPNAGKSTLSNQLLGRKVVNAVLLSQIHAAKSLLLHVLDA